MERFQPARAGAPPVYPVRFNTVKTRRDSLKQPKFALRCKQLLVGLICPIGQRLSSGSLCTGPARANTRSRISHPSQARRTKNWTTHVSSPFILFAVHVSFIRCLVHRQCTVVHRRRVPPSWPLLTWFVLRPICTQSRAVQPPPVWPLVLQFEQSHLLSRGLQACAAHLTYPLDQCTVQGSSPSNFVRPLQKGRLRGAVP